MKDQETFIKISKMLAEPMEKLYKTGGLGLLIVFVGLLLTLYVFIFSYGKFSLPTFGIGFVLIFTSFILYSTTHYQGTITIRRTRKSSAETLDTLKEMSIPLVLFTFYTQACNYKNLDKINRTINASLPLIKTFLGTKRQHFDIKIDHYPDYNLDLILK